MAVAVLVGEAGVVRRRAHARLDEPGRERVHLTARQTVDDAGLPAMTREDVLDLALEIRAREHAIHEVRPVERSDQLDRRAQAELRHDVAPDAAGGRCRERVEARVRPAVAQRRELAVLGPEVMAPLADAVRLVDGHESRRAAAEEREKSVAALADEPLGRNVDQAVPSVADAGSDRRAFLGRERAVEPGRVDAVGDERVDLIFHQRDERRHDERQTVAHERGRLKTQRLAAAGREHDERVASGEDRVHRLALQRTERRVAPELFENGGERGHDGLS